MCACRRRRSAVVCDASGAVLIRKYDGRDFASNQLTGSISSSIGLLVNLEYLCVCGGAPRGDRVTF